MNKMFVEDVLDFGKKNRRQPGPTTYEPIKTFSATGEMYTMRAKADRYGEKEENFSKNYLDRQKKLPGPGYYAHPDTIGKNNSSTRYNNNRMSKFALAKDRW